MTAPVQGNQVQQPLPEPQQTAAEQTAPPKTFYTQATDMANCAWDYSVQKAADLKDGMLSLVTKVMEAVVNFIEMVAGWCGYAKPAVTTQQNPPTPEEAAPQAPHQPEEPQVVQQAALAPDQQPQELRIQTDQLQQQNGSSSGSSPVVVEQPRGWLDWLLW